MKCKRCNAEIIGYKKVCPLCQNQLIDDGNISDNVFPVIKKGRGKERTFTKIMTITLFLASIICVMMNVALFPEVAWSVFVVAGSACFWILLKLALKSRKHLPKAIFWEMFLLASLSAVWDLSMGFRGWSINFVIPIIITFSILLIRIMAIIFKSVTTDYIFYLILSGILGTAPLIFILLNMLDVTLPSMICVIVSITSLAILFIFDRRNFLNEIERRAHI